ncbi:MAG: cytochrome c oxidase subunit II, partial [Thermicanus sp.]|nr:cytochrome c oxidase subunit II [Thermicanus sp.]
VFILLFYVLIRFRQRKGDEGIPKQVEGNNLLEVVWTIIPVILLIILAVPTVMKTFALAEDHANDPNALKVKVTAHQYWWEFEYPDLGIKTAEDLYIPVGKKISVELTSNDVIHSFWIPALSGKWDANPGMIGPDGKKNVNRFSFDADNPGVYQGKCAELCGPSHALMEFKVIAVTEEEFNAWVDGMKKPLTVATNAAKAGEAVFTQNCASCHAVDSTDKSIKVGPNLDNLANRKTIAGILPNGSPEEFKESLKKWIEDPAQVKPQNEGPKTIKMPAFGGKIKDQDLNNLIEYLSGLNSNQ